MRVGPVYLAALVAACGPEVGAGRPDALVTVDAAVDGAMPSCLAGSGWVTKAVTSTPSTGTYDGQIAFTASGEMLIAFAEPESEASSNQDIFTTRLSDCQWSPPEVRNGVSTYQFAYPTIVSRDETVHLAFSGLFNAATGNNDVYYTKRVSNAWTGALPLTTNAPGSGLGSYNPRLATAPSSGELSVAFLFAGDTASVPTEVHVAAISSGGQLQGKVKPITGIAGGCDDPQLVYDGKGTRHLVAVCGFASDARVYYTHDAGGTFIAPVTIDSATGLFNSSPSLTLDADGETLHLAWRRDIPCASSECAEILYSKRAGTSWSTPIHVNGDSTDGERFPTIGVLDNGTIHIGFERDVGSNSDIFVATSTNGTSFTETLITPGTDETSETLPGSMTIDPTTGHPLFTFSKVTSTTPFNMDVWRAELVAPLP
jgi:hypothetical protein